LQLRRKEKQNVPRKSAAALAVVAGTIDGRPPPPSDLTPYQAEVWRRTVASEASSFFKTAALQQMLRQYCGHVEAAHLLSLEISKFDPAWLLSVDDADLKYNRLLAMRERESRAAMACATKLRLTNQSRWQPAAAHTAAKSAPVAKPWQEGG
jgi:hypothetical protein